MNIVIEKPKKTVCIANLRVCLESDCRYFSAVNSRCMFAEWNRIEYEKVKKEFAAVK